VKLARHAAALACVLLAPAVAGCELVLREHRSGRVLQRVALSEPSLSIAFEHSVLGTTVTDRYEFRPHAVLIEERFDGQGYGLPYVAAPGERLTHDANGSRLELQRRVEPLVVRPLPAQRMRLLLPSGPLLLGELTTQAIELHAEHCTPAGSRSSRRTPGSTAWQSASQRVDPGFRRDDATQRKRTT
jgi:hypothetical protein